MMTPARTINRLALVSSRALVSLTAAKGAPSLAAQSDAVVTALILQASDAASAYCGLSSVGGASPTFARQSLSETLVYPTDPYPAQPRSLTLSMPPISVTSLRIDGAAADLADFRIDWGGRIEPRATAAFRTFPADVEIEVQYWGGYVTAIQKTETTPPAGPELPADIERAVILIAQHFFGLQNRANFDLAARVEENEEVGRIETRYFSADRGAGIPADAAFLLGPHRRLL
jgi:hypothetical protein